MMAEQTKSTIQRMGRPQLFEEPQVLEAAMMAFWQNGYTGTSMADLRAATGLNPGSIYNRFGSKKGLFLCALDFYIDQVVDQRIRDILNEGAPLQGIEAFFTTAYDTVPAQELIGCLLTNTAMDREIIDKQINRGVAKGIRRTEQAFERRLKQARESDSIPPEIDIESAATHLVSCFQGLSVIGRLTRDKKRLHAITTQALAVLHR